MIRSDVGFTKTGMYSTFAFSIVSPCLSCFFFLFVNMSFVCTVGDVWTCLCVCQENVSTYTLFRTLQNTSTQRGHFSQQALYEACLFVFARYRREYTFNMCVYTYILIGRDQRRRRLRSGKHSGRKKKAVKIQRKCSAV